MNQCVKYLSSWVLSSIGTYQSFQPLLRFSLVNFALCFVVMSSLCVDFHQVQPFPLPFNGMNKFMHSCMVI
jgi:hypothetical protein